MSSEVFFVCCCIVALSCGERLSLSWLSCSMVVSRQSANHATSSVLESFAMISLYHGFCDRSDRCCATSALL